MTCGGSGESPLEVNSSSVVTRLAEEGENDGELDYNGGEDQARQRVGRWLVCIPSERHP